LLHVEPGWQYEAEMKMLNISSGRNIANLLLLLNFSILKTE